MPPEWAISYTNRMRHGCPSIERKHGLSLIHREGLQDEVVSLSYVPFHVSEMAFSLSIPHPIVGDRKDLPGGKL